MKTEKYRGLWTTIKARLKKPPTATAALLKPPTETISDDYLIKPDELLARLREFLFEPNEPDAHLNPKWLAVRLGAEEREMLDALAYAVRDGLVELHWEVYCPACGARPLEFGSLKEAKCRVDCPACGNDFDLHLDRDVRVTFSASDNLRRTRGDESVSLPAEASEHAATRGLDLLLAPMFRQLFSNETPALNESLRIGRVAVLFTDLRGSTAIYATRGDPRAYRMVREHFDILTAAIERNRGVLVKTIGDSVMASFAASADAVRSALEAQTQLGERIEQIGGELILKAGVHAGACLAVNLNDRLDFFGGAVNTAARVQGLSHGGDVVVTGEVFDELKSGIDGAQIVAVESFDSRLRGLPAPIRVHRLVSTHQKTQVQ